MILLRLGQTMTGKRRRLALMVTVGWAIAGTVPARAGDQPLYQPAPGWVAPVPSLDLLANGAGGQAIAGQAIAGQAIAGQVRSQDAGNAGKGPSLVVLDQQVHFDKGKVWSYFDRIVQAETPEALTQIGTLTGAWSPGKGDFIVHRATIVRDGHEIDLLAGEKFNVLRREARLEHRMIDGTLTATMPVSGLRVGDLLRFTYSVTQEDSMLAGRAQVERVLPSAPISVGFARLRVSWPNGTPLQWRLTPTPVVPAAGWPAITPHREAGDWVLDLPLPLPKRPLLPDDAPLRVRHVPLFQAGTFSSWSDVSRIMAPLFSTDGAIQPGSPVAGEVDAIMATTRDPRERAARALELVQSRISYLMLGMNDGNYVPQPVAETWEKRFGDCKAKTLLLLAMLRRMGIESEPVLAALQGGDSLPTLLPMAGAFDHVLVRAVINGHELWLDGTGAASRLADLDDVPPLGHVLPLRKGGADLLTLTWHRAARADSHFTIVMDESAGIDLPALVDVTMTTKGATGAMIALAGTQAPREKRDEITRNVLRALFPDFDLIDSSIVADPVAGTATLHTRGMVSSPWAFERAGAHQAIDFMRKQAHFNPDRARAVWRDIPVSLGSPLAQVVDLDLRLPEGGKGYRIEGDADFSGEVAGKPVERHTTIEGGRVLVHERIDTPASGEIPAGKISAAKVEAAHFIAHAPSLRAPIGALRFWQVRDPGRARFAALDAAYAAVIAARPDEPDLYANRARFRHITFDRTGAYADFARALAIAPTVPLYADRADLYEEDGDYRAALKDMDAAQDIDPVNHVVAARRAHLMLRLGRKDEALALRKDEIDNAGPDRAEVVTKFGEVQSDAGEPEAALAELDKAAEEKPGSPEILNLRCWIKGTRQVGLDSALKDCTRAIELADFSAAALDSRALVYFRLGRFEDALADLDAVLDAAPGLAGSLFLRAVVEARLGKNDSARDDLASARALVRSIDRQYRDYGIAAPALPGA